MRVRVQFYDPALLWSQIDIYVFIFINGFKDRNRVNVRNQSTEVSILCMNHLLLFLLFAKHVKKSKGTLFCTLFCILFVS